MEPIKCLDKGFVRLVDVMGDDAAVVQAARVSYGHGTKTVNEDRGLIRYLMRFSHSTPMEMAELKFHIKMPIFIARQHMRHRTASTNELSGRYSEMKDEFYVPDVEMVTKQSSHNKQGGSSELVEGPSSERGELQSEGNRAFAFYQGRLKVGMRRELARVNLPLSTYTEFYWKIDLHNLLHYLRLRLDSHAQYEIRVYAEAIAQIVKEKFPLVWEAFEDYRLNAIQLSGLEVKALQKALANPILKSVLLDETKKDLETLIPNKREREEFLQKLNLLTA